MSRQSNTDELSLMLIAAVIIPILIVALIIGSCENTSIAERKARAREAGTGTVRGYYDRG